MLDVKDGEREEEFRIEALRVRKDGCYTGADMRLQSVRLCEAELRAFEIYVWGRRESCNCCREPSLPEI